MSTETPIEAESDQEHSPQPAETSLPRSFLIEASGPVTKRTRVSDSLVETEETEVSISRHVGTLEAFDAVYAQRDARRWKKNVVKKLLSEESSEGVVYEFDAGDWSVQVDGRADAFRGVIEALADPDLETGGDPRMGDGNYSLDLMNHHRSLTKTNYDEDDVFASLVDNCRQSPLFGPGAAIAKLDAKHAARENIEGYAERLLEDVRENGGE